MHNKNNYATSLTIILSIVFASAVAFAATPDDKAYEGQVAIADLTVVDCLLPGQVRQLGNRTFLSARRPTRTTSADCRLRGGEYVAWDRADYKSALKVWMPSAESGSADAQTNVGEIFERGLGGDPNYTAALIWYRKAAKQGNTRAQFNLGTLYEQGHGVPKNQVEALNWYRLAWGISEDNIMFSSAVQREQEELRNTLQKQLTQKEQQMEVLNRRLEALEREKADSQVEEADSQVEMSTLRILVQQLEQQRDAQKTELTALPAPPEQPAVREPASAPEPERSFNAGGTEKWFKDVKLGRYYALLIGNAEYQELEDLRTPVNDVARAKQILEDKYGFKVFVVQDGDHIEVMQAINDINDLLDEDDNLLLFYAGHGSRLQVGNQETGYWLPSNAEPPPRNTYWVPNEFVTGHLSRIKAKHVLIVADSCYAGLLSNEPSFLLIGDKIPEYSNPEFMRFKSSKRARLLLSSGGDNPVLDGTGDGHSVFARAFLDELENNNSVMAAPQLYLKIRDKVRLAAAELNFKQQPEFKAIKAAGHEVGDFFFVPEALQ